jgi:hypothetical protein
MPAQVYLALAALLGSSGAFSAQAALAQADEQLAAVAPDSAKAKVGPPHPKRTHCRRPVHACGMHPGWPLRRLGVAAVLGHVHACGMCSWVSTIRGCAGWR